MCRGGGGLLVLGGGSGAGGFLGRHDDGVVLMDRLIDRSRAKDSYGSSKRETVSWRRKEEEAEWNG